MIVVEVKLVVGVLSSAQKRALIKALTDAVVSVEGDHVRPVTWVLLSELASGNFGVGGMALKTNDARAIAAGALL
jgi:4-oxalocrotonate tautomerase